MGKKANEAGRFFAYVPPELEELIPRFMENMRQNLERMRQALQKNDLEIARMIGHDMKGVGKSYGFDEISRIGKELENAAIKKSVREVNGSLNLLADYIENVKIIILEE